MLGFLAGVATGYVFGTRAGRERYDQLVQTCRRVTNHPTVQNATGKARAKAEAVTGPPQEDRETSTAADATPLNPPPPGPPRPL